MSIFNSIKELAEGVINKNAEKVTGALVKRQLVSGNTEKFNHLVAELIGDHGSVGGLSKLIGKFDSANLGHLAQSWVGDGENAPLGMSQVKSVFGESWLKKFAGQLGLKPLFLTMLLSYLIPRLVNSITKEGKLPEQVSHEGIDIKSLLTSLIK
ncbi:MAG: YidB family protein [Neisseriaceae bacterium]